MNPISQRRLNSAIEAARLAGAVIKDAFRKPLEVEYKGAWDPVTEIDRRCEKLISGHLAKEHPEIAFWGEEGGYEDSHAPLTWCVDPLDGTKNFVHGYPFVAVAIALLHDDQPQIGVVYDPLRDELYHAVKGHGAFRNGESVSVSRATRLKEALAVTGMTTWPEVQGTFILRACEQIQGLRRGGASALDLCQVAAGQLDAMWEWSLQPWDMAAAVLMIEEAQGTVTKLDGSRYDLMGGQILATNTHLHRAFVTMLTP